MTPRSDSSYARRASHMVAVVAVTFVMAAASVAFAQVGSVRDTRPYAPYTAGPVVRESRPFTPDTRPYAPYTAGPVVRESR